MESIVSQSYENRKVLLPAEAGALVGDDNYFFSSKYNLLYKVHIPDFSISIISRIPIREVLAFAWFRKMLYWNEKLILVPEFAERVWIYNLKKGDWESIIIDYSRTGLKFWGAVIYKDNAFLFGERYPAILKIDLNDYSVSYINIKGWSEGEREGLFFTNVVRVNNMAYSPVSIANEIFQLNLDTLEYEWRQVGDIKNQYSGIDFDGYDFWLSPGKSGKAVRWNGRSEWEEFEVPEEIKNDFYQFIGVICDGNKAIFLTQQEGKNLEIVSEGSEKIQMLITKEAKPYIHLEHYENETIVLMQSNADIAVKWNGEWIKGICAIEYEKFKEYDCEGPLWNALAADGIGKEADIFDVNDYINMIAEEQTDINTDIPKSGNGINIWEKLKQY